MALFKNPESAERQTQGNCFLQCGKTDALNQKARVSQKTSIRENSGKFCETMDNLTNTSI